MSEWVYARAYECWSVTWRGFCGRLPKLTITCGLCGRRSRSEARRADLGRVFVWCGHCGIANAARGLTVQE